jgi:hypothetical protein
MERAADATTESISLLSLLISGVPANAYGSEPSLWAGGYWTHDWQYETARLTNSGSSLLAMLPSTPYSVRQSIRVSVLNGFSHIREPGQFAVDWSAGIAAVWPYEPVGKAAPLEMTQLDTLLTLRNISNVKISGLNFLNALGTAIIIDNSNNVTMSDIKVMNAGREGVKISGGRDVSVVDSIVSRTGRTGIWISGGDRISLRPSNHRIERTVISQTGQIARTYHPAVFMGGVGQHIENSYITEAPHSAIIFEGNDHRITRNEIEKVVQETDDSGAIYGGRNWTWRGTQISENFIHDVIPQPGLEVKGVYLDDMLSGTTISRNLFKNVMQPIFVGGGRDNIVTENIFLYPIRSAMYFDRRGETWAKHWVDCPTGLLCKRLHEVPYNAEPYLSRYPSLEVLLANDPGKPTGNRVGPNIVHGGPAFSIDPDIVHLIDFDPNSSTDLDVQDPLRSDDPDVLEQTLHPLAEHFDLPLEALRQNIAYLRRRLRER